MAKNKGLLAELRAGLGDDRTSITSLLQKCILLGGEVGSAQLRDWARQELKGYPNVDTMPDYRWVTAPLCIDGATFHGLVTGQTISPMSLPDFARDTITERVPLARGIAELESLSRTDKLTVKLVPPGAQDLVLWMNHENPGGHQITRLYWDVSRSAIEGVVMAVRTALAELVGELLAAVPNGDQAPSKQATDDAIHFVITGDRNTVTVVGSQTTTGGNATITTTGSAEATPSEKETWWQRWRKRGLLIGLATVVAAAAGVFQWLGWMPWK
ncbi:hypothetical protein [Amycolatopsis sp. lyj-84]|uniref:AbiTii domain-containing protein n=1 Tax=Amycolatopsis sp. lyj-84 TaxID=2789284 RepID=UPI00397A3972